MSAERSPSPQPQPANDKPDARQSMNRMYKLTRHVYDGSRKFYLLGRDLLIRELGAKPGEHIIEVGCGTARNLIKMARHYPDTHFYGLDAADEMLKTAEASLRRAGLSDHIKIGQGLAQTFDPKRMFGLKQTPDKIVFSYVLSMIPDATQAIDHALDLLPVGGEIHIADFGDLSGQISPVRVTLRNWLKLFHVRHDPELVRYYYDLGARQRCHVSFTPLYNDYAYRAVLTKR